MILPPSGMPPPSAPPPAAVSLAPDADRPAASSAPPVVHTDRLTKRYGTHPALEGVSLGLHAGEILGVLGPNGAGKTTALRLILGFLVPSGGAVRVFGAAPRSWRARPLRRRIGYLPGDLAFDDSESGARLLDLYARLSGCPATLRAELCECLGLEAADLRMPVRRYSRGMKQKLGIVAALQHAPALIVLDEPTNALDPTAQQALYDLLRAQRARGAAILFSTHVLHEALDLCDRIAVLAEGRLMDCFSVRQFTLDAPRLLYVQLAAEARNRFAQPPHLPLAQFLRAEEGDWLVYRVDPGAIVPAVHELTRLPVADVRIESAALDHLLDYYRFRQGARR